jgi:hypothetical protein
MQANIAAEKSEIRASNMKWAPTRQKECRTCSEDLQPFLPELCASKFYFLGGRRFDAC